MKKHILLKSFGYALLNIVFMVFAGVVTVILQTGDVGTLLITAVFVWLAVFLGLFLMKRSGISFSEYGLAFPPANKKDGNRYLWFIPLVLIEAAVLIMAGFFNNITVIYYLSVLIFVIAVGFAEEVYFRGLILKLLQQKGSRYAVVVSSLLFALGHASNLLRGADPIKTVLQIVFAGLFGYICAIIVLLSNNLWVVIVWHAAHDFLAMVTNEVGAQQELLILGLQVAVMIGYAVYLTVVFGKYLQMEKAQRGTSK